MLHRFWKVTIKPIALWPISLEDAYLKAVAYDLHGFYTGLEGIFESVADNIDDHLPGGESWHKALLEQMYKEIQGVRPALLSDNARESFCDEGDAFCGNVLRLPYHEIFRRVTLLMKIFFEDNELTSHFKHQMIGVEAYRLYFKKMNMINH